METMSTSRLWLRTRLAASRLLNDCSGIAATEFAMIVPIMLVIFFGTVEISTGVAVDRKVTLVARTLSDLTSQAAPPTQAQSWSTVDDNYLQNVFTASIAILNPYAADPAQLTISEVYVDSTKTATIQWSRAATIAPGATQVTLVPCGATQATLVPCHTPGENITNKMPPALLVPQTYLIFSEVSYNYAPLGVGYVMKTNVMLRDVAYTRPRQVVCVVYITPNPTLPPPDPVTGQQCPTP
jgi:Flp pilus assembly protein TadG